MRAIVGGTVIGVEHWSYANKQTGEQVPMLKVWLQGSGRTNDQVAVPAALGVPDQGDDVFYVADVSVRQQPRRDGGYWPPELSCWAKEQVDDPFAGKPAGSQLHAVNEA
jgi:hypothetical protein